ncbi:hypothetical protein [Corallococcus sp. 4LFB]
MSAPTFRLRFLPLVAALGCATSSPSTVPTPPAAASTSTPPPP